MDVKAAKSVQRAYRKVQRTGEALATAKGDEDVLKAVEDHEKAKKAYGRALNKAQDS